MKTIKKYGRATVAAILLLALLIGIVFLVYPVKAEPLDTYHSSWHLVRETASEDGAAFVNVYNLTTSGNFANKDTTSHATANGGAFQIVSRQAASGPHEGYSAGSKWMFAFCGENFNNLDDTFSYSLIGWSKTNGMLQTICEGAGALGTQAVVVYPDGGDALGRTCSATAAVFDLMGGTQAKYFTVEDESFDGAIAGQLAYVTGTNITSGYYQVLVVTDSNNVSIDVTAINDNTDSTVQINPAFWADTLTITDYTKWSATADPNHANVNVYNSANNEVAILEVELTGIEWIQFVIYAADAATSEEAGNITVYGRRY